MLNSEASALVTMGGMETPSLKIPEGTRNRFTAGAVFGAYKC